MKTMFETRRTVLCAFCSQSRKIYKKRRGGLVDAVTCMLMSIITVLILFNDLDPRAFVIFVFYMALAEAFIQIRWKLTIVCRHCGFDPSLYLKSAAKASEKVNVFLARRKKDPDFLLRPNLNLPTRPAESDNKSPNSH